ncbi:sugar phosphate nucleotidyltransferase [Rhodohalobacter barkolensis]|uniref:Glucose-1-phosphate thymidylyltransferase n=1 Tax=Rhodohalobacter barkolensis TaxID=2053187 RepID=A0A2N0VGW0_9BACT|nr:sugar phosphate nucleotidyltransferase [Rhodohalobacter barkolensis]PKD43446.1 glucose-1-phosphate thymidylyltransferase [Rhodohalobacter barkolensis]
MKLIIPMAGRGTRVRPHSHTTPKPLLPVAGTMIVERIVETFARTLDRTIDEIVYILGPDFSREIKETLTDMSKRHNAKATFRVQDVALGTAHAVSCAGEDLEGEVIIVFADTIFDSYEKVTVDDADSVIWLKEVEDPSRFGVAVHDGDTITDFVEKPSEPISNLAIIGVYYFKQGEDLMKEIQYLLDNNVTGHGDEYQLTDALDRLLKDGKKFKKATVDEWLDCGTLPAWLETTGEILKKENHPYDDYKGTTIHPPVYIGKGVEISGSEIGPNVSIEDGTKIKNSTIERTIIQKNAQLNGCKLEGSTIGNHAEAHNAKGEIHIGDHSILKQ